MPGESLSGAECGGTGEVLPRSNDDFRQGTGLGHQNPRPVQLTRGSGSSTSKEKGGAWVERGQRGKRGVTDMYGLGALVV